LFAVPVVAFVNVVVSYLARGSWRSDPVALAIEETDTAR